MHRGAADRDAARDSAARSASLHPRPASLAHQRNPRGVVRCNESVILCNISCISLHAITCITYYYMHYMHYMHYIQLPGLLPLHALLVTCHYTMRCESHFNPSFGIVKAFNLKKLKLTLSPSPQWPQAALRLGGDGRQVP